MISSSESENQKKLLTHLNSNFRENGKNIIILLDADRTLYEPDTSRILVQKTDLDINEIKFGFKSGYTYNGFYLMNQIYSKIEPNLYLKLSREIAQNINFYPGIESFLDNSQSYADIIIVSSGIKEILDSIFSNKGYSNIPRIAGTHFLLDKFIIGRNEKGIICEFFKSLGKKIIAFGDSDVDSLMLKKADYAVVVVNHKNNIDLMDHLKDQRNISQISFKDYIHPNIPITTYKEFLDTHQHLFSSV